MANQWPSKYHRLIRPEIKKWFIDREEIAVGDPLQEVLLLRSYVGPRADEGMESLDITLATVSWLRTRLKQSTIISGRHLIIMKELSPDKALESLRVRLNKMTGNSWNDLSLELSRIGAWEFEDSLYKQQTSPFHKRFTARVAGLEVVDRDYLLGEEIQGEGFSLLVRIDIEVQGGMSKELCVAEVRVCDPLWIESALARREVFEGMDHLFVNDDDLHVVAKYTERLVESMSSSSINGVVEKLSSYFNLNNADAT